QAPVRKSPLTASNGTATSLEKTTPAENKTDAEIAGNDQQEREVVLLVEDNADVLTFLTKLLGDRYELLTAVDGEEGLNTAQSEIPDLIISDVMMPKMDGFELCEKLKSDPRTSHIPVIILTAKGTKADQLEGLRTGADAYLMKPFEAEELFLRIDNLFHMRERLQCFFSGQAVLAEGASSEREKEVVQVESTFLQQLREIVKSQLDSPNLSTSYLAQEMSLSDSQLYRKLKALTNQSPSVFVRDQRLEYAAVLLRNPELHIAEVAYRCGFNDPNYFSRVFHRKYGQSPRDYRMKQ
ncbi:MAG: response regulator, partial [Bacteroidota bacterium]